MALAIYLAGPGVFGPPRDHDAALSAHNAMFAELAKRDGGVHK